MTVIFDVTSLMLRRHAGAMTGIDRVEYALASWLCGPGRKKVGEIVFLIQTRYGRGVIGAARMARELSDMAVVRGQAATPSSMIEAISERLGSPCDVSRQGAMRFRGPEPSRWRMGGDRFNAERLAAQGHAAFSRLLQRAAGPIIYVHASHYGLQWMSRYAWIQRHKVKAAFFLHDVIPIDGPEFCSPSAMRSHGEKLATISRFGTLAAVNSQYSAERLAEALKSLGLPAPPISVHRLGNGGWPFADSSNYAQTSKVGLSERPYFLCAGTIEGRKNVGLLLEVWRLLASGTRSEQMPFLVIAGQRGWNNDAVLRDLDDMPDIGPFIVEANGVNDADMAILMTGARAVLTPSFMEGFSLVPAQALALGVPVFASDIPAHRELGPDVTLLSLNAAKWKGAIESAGESAGNTILSAARKFSWLDFAERLFDRILDQMHSASQL
jgi:glycosyltransferase involved in cell wall biosynthesis